ncbi:MAG: hypothetical protein U5R31_17770 [Acidimicrobiia bacterium]|nr:hypothetical protein [Acidimicrobiia bacterium]
MSDFDVGPINLIGLVKTRDDARFVFDLTAVDAAENEVPEVVSKPGEEPPRTGLRSPRPSSRSSRSRAPAGHEPDASGSGEWEVETAEDAQEFASGLALVTETRYMPPWLASEEGVPLEHPNRLAEDEIAAIQEWADAGGPLDVDPDTPIEAVEPVYDPPEHDSVLRIPEPYQGTPTVQNDYRCFVLEPGLDEDAVVTGYEFLPDQLEIVHHALVYRLQGSAMDAIQEADDRDEGPGWECFGDINVRGASVSPDGTSGASDLVMGWAPGQRPTSYPDGTGLHLDEDEVFVVQLHYHITHEAPPDQSGFALSTPRAARTTTTTSR